MKRKAVLAVGALVILIMAMGVMALGRVACVQGNQDFRLRFNELACLRQGVDPFDVWNGSVEKPPYYPNTREGGSPYEHGEAVNAYVPWEYSLMYPLSFLDVNRAGWLYSLMMASVLVAFLMLGYRACISVGLSKIDGVLTTAVSTLMVSHAIWSDVQVGNFGILTVFATMAIAMALRGGHDVLAGIFWMLLMVKPQIGLAFAIPMLMRWKWRTGVTAGALCLLAAVPPALMCGKSVLDMLMEGPAANVFFFEGCGTWPKFLCGLSGSEAGIVLGTLIGAAVCAAMTWLVRKERDWIVYLMPAAITSCCWTYTQAYSHAMGWFVAFVILRELLLNPGSRFLRVAVSIACVCLPRWTLALHGFCGFFGFEYPISEYAFRCIESVNSMASLALAFAVCVWFNRRESERRTIKI